MMLRRNSQTVLLLLAVLLAGAGAVWWTEASMDRHLRESLLREARLIQEALNPDRIRALSGTERDRALPDYTRLKDQIIQVRQSIEKCRFVYLLGRRPDGKVFFFVDSESPGSRDESPPGQIFQEVTAENLEVFERRVPRTVGPTSDRWGTWISALVPVVDHRTKELLAVVGLDVDAREWRSLLLRAALVPLSFTGLLFLLVVADAMWTAHRRRTAPEDFLRLRFRDPLRIVTVGLVLTGFAAWTAHQYEDRSRKGTFSQLGDGKTAALGETLRDLCDNEIEGLARFYEGSREVTREEFQRFAGYLSRNRAVRIWGWAPAVAAGSRTAFENEARTEGVMGFEIWEPDPKGNRRRAFDRPVYYPIRRVIPLKGNRELVGFDLGSETRRRTVLESARQTGLITGTDSIPEGGAPTGGKSMLILRPVFFAEDLRNLRGFVLAVPGLEALLRSARPDETVGLALAIGRPGGSPELLAYGGSDVRFWDNGPTARRPIFACGKVFFATGLAGPQFDTLYPRRAGGLTLLIGLILTGSLALVISLIEQRRERLEELVARRTADLQASQDRYRNLFETADRTARRRQREAEVINALASSEEMAGGDVRKLAVRLTQGASEALEVERVSVWLFEEGGRQLVCLDSYLASSEEHASGAVLREEEFSNEFLALKDSNYVAAEDPYTDPRTAGYVQGYLKPNRITSMLDCAIRIGDRTQGAVCFEQVDRPHHWEDDEISFACQLADQLSLALSNRERRQAEAAWRESEQRFRELYDSVSDLIYTQDLEGRFLTANRAMKNLFQYEPGEFLGRTAADFMKPELRAFYETEYLRTIRLTGRHQGVTAYYARDGQRFYLEYVSVLVTPEEGEPFISGIARDVTDRVQAQRAVREREQRIQAILEATPIPLVVYDTEGHPQFLNPAFTRIFGWILEELKGGTIPYVPEDQKDKTAEAIGIIYRTGESSTFETRRSTRDGRLLDILISAALIMGPKGRPAGMVVSLTDMTEQKKIEAGLLQIQKLEAVGVLAGGIAHDFNNLLMGVQGNASLMLMELKPDHPFYRRLRDIEQYSRQGAMLTRQLLGFARGGKYEVKPLNLNTVIAEHDQVFGRTRKDVTIREVLETDPFTVACDESQIRQVLMNLYINAADAMPGGGTILVRTRNVTLTEAHGRPFRVIPGRYLQISVSDSGSGMDEAVRKRVFEPFFTTKEVGRGTGLGLSSVYGIVKNHGGFIEVESAVGQGTTFHIYLPISDKKTSPPAGKNPPETGPGPLTGTGTILLVDDEEMILEVGRAMLEQMGYRVLTARQAREALALYEEQGKEIDLVILDLIMPEMGGGPLFDRLKALNPEIKVLLASGYSLDGQAREILDRGCRGFIQKPFNLVEILTKIKEILPFR